MRTPVQLVKIKDCPKHAKVKRPCHVCYGKAEEQRDSQARATARALHQEYLARLEAGDGSLPA